MRKILFDVFISIIANLITPYIQSYFTDILSIGKEVINMSWLQNNLILLLSVAVNIIQAWNVHTKNSNDARLSKQTESNREKERERRAKIESKKIEKEAFIQKQKLDFKLEKLKLNSQYGSNQTYLRVQRIFEKYISEMLDALNKDNFPYTFAKDHQSLENLVMFYCPEVITTINNFNMLNTSFEESGTGMSKEEYISEAKSECKYAIYNSLIKSLNKKLFQLSGQQQSKE